MGANCVNVAYTGLRASTAMVHEAALLNSQASRQRMQVMLLQSMKATGM